MSLTTADLARIERKLDLIIDAFGLSKHPRLTPSQIADKVKNDVLKFQTKRRIKNEHDGTQS